MDSVVLHLDQVPQALHAFRHWVLWRWERRDGNPVKVPYTFMGYRASTTNPETWSRLEFLLQILGKNPDFAAGVGFVVTAGDPFVGIDLDDCLNDSGSVKLWAEALIRQFADTYIEVTPSGAGLRIWCIASTARAMKKSLPDGAIEIYSTARYFTFTGDRFNAAPLEITNHQADIDQLFAAYAPTTSTSYNGISTKIAAGDRYPAFCSIAGTLRKRGVCPQAIEAAILAMNEHQADPPKSNAEIRKDIRKILASAEKWS